MKVDDGAHFYRTERTLIAATHSAIRNSPTGRRPISMQKQLGSDCDGRSSVRTARQARQAPPLTLFRNARRPVRLPSVGPRRPAGWSAKTPRARPSRLRYGPASPRGPLGIAGFDGLDDGDVFLEADGVAARRGEQAADAVERHAGVLHRRTDAREAGRSHQQVMEGQVERVKARAVVGFDRCVLVAQVAAQFGGKRCIRRLASWAAVSASRARRRNMFSRTSARRISETVEPLCGLMSTRPSAFSRLSASATGKRDTSNACRESGLVEHRAGLQLQRDDRLAQDLHDPVGGPALQGTGNGGESDARSAVDFMLTC